MLLSMPKCSKRLISNVKQLNLWIQSDKPFHLFNPCFKTSHTELHTTAANALFFEFDRKGGYDTEIKRPPVKTMDQIKFGLKELKKDIKLWKQEVKDKFQKDPFFYYQAGLTDVVWDFKDPEVLEKIVTTCDSDFAEGYSKCDLEMSKAGRALFSGYLDLRVPKDGRVTKAGYCAMRSIRYQKSFSRNACYDWTMYNTFVMKVRGDGRPYLINLSIEGTWDITWNDIYQYVLYTRGGPYWQIVKIPFSKFVFSSKGRLQDKQYQIQKDRVTHFGISCGERIAGPFSLEIEYVGVEDDPEHNEEFAYEMYKTDVFLS